MKKRAIPIFCLSLSLLLSISFYAAFLDSKEISYQEAVDVISAIRVVEGYPDGSFHPQSTLTRRAATKIIARLLLTPERAERLYKRNSSFRDVQFNNEFVSYIVYCYEEGLISGYSDGTFRPEDSLTANAFLKMLLCAVGYQQSAQGYTGDRWQEHVQRDAAERRITRELPEGFRYDAPLTREQAALFVLNTLRSDLITYANGKAVPQTIDSGNKAYSNMDDSLNDGNQVIQFAEKYFPGLSRTVMDGYIFWSFEPSDQESWYKRYPVGSLSAFDLSITVTLNPNGGSVHTSEISVSFGKNYGLLPNPSRKGYVFQGWYTSPGGGQRVKATDTVQTTQNHTLYAQWEIEPTQNHIITLNPNGGSVSPQTLTVYKNGLYSALPTPKRENYRFDGWFTSGGQEITKDSKVLLNTGENQTLYAHWTREYTVTLDANGGSVSPKTMIVYEGGTYEGLPEPGRAGYSFDGWHTSLNGGAQITLSTKVSLSGNQTLYAHWQKSEYILTLDANGGSINDSSISKVTVRRGKSVNLDNYAPKWQNHSFVGWFSVAQDGEGEKFSSWNPTSDKTFYAHWLSSPEEKAVGILNTLDIVDTVDTLSQLKYRFANDQNGFGYHAGYKIPLERYQYMFGINARSKQMYSDDYDKSPIWIGSCYGISGTAAMFYVEGNDVSVKSFKESASVPYDLELEDANLEWGNDLTSSSGLTLKQFIEAVQISQSSIEFSKEHLKNKNELNALCKALSDFEKDCVAPVVICIHGKDEDGQPIGHAVLGYHLEEVSDDESRIYVYDPNTPNNSDCCVVMSKNGNGSYVGWSFEMSDETGEDSFLLGSRQDGELSFISYDVYKSIWDKRGNPDSNAADMNLMSSNCSNATIYDESGSKIAVFENGELLWSDSSMEIYPVVNLDGGTSAMGMSVWLPADATYSIQNEDELDHYTVSISNLTDGVRVKNLDSNYAILGVKDQASMIVAFDNQSSGYTVDVTTAKNLTPVAKSPIHFPDTPVFSPPGGDVGDTGGAGGGIAPTGDEPVFFLSFDGDTMSISNSNQNGSVIVNEEEVRTDMRGQAELK